ncbi:MAG: hypothetical protein AABN95_23055 [Acidobacteriota bacterium]
MKLRLLLILLVFAYGLLVPVGAQTPRYARVISANANLRDTPSIADGGEQEVTEDTLVKVLDEKLPWYVVRVGNRVGWMHGNTLEFITSQTPVAGPPTEQTVAPVYVPPTTPSRRRENLPETTPSAGGSSRPGTGSDRGYIRGPRGGCYYISGSGRKVYVDRSLCN